MSKNVSVAEIKAHFADWVRAAEAGESVVITRHGKPVVALVPAGELEQLRRLRAAGPGKGLIIIAGGGGGAHGLPEPGAGVRPGRAKGFSRLDRSLGLLL